MKVYLKILYDKIMSENKVHISTGVIGTQWLMRGLHNMVVPDIAYTLASNQNLSQLGLYGREWRNNHLGTMEWQYCQSQE